MILVYVNLSNTPIKSPPARQYQRSLEVADKVMEVAGEEIFNFTVIAERNYDGAYGYFLEKDGAKRRLTIAIYV